MKINTIYLKLNKSIQNLTYKVSGYYFYYSVIRLGQQKAAGERQAQGPGLRDYFMLLRTFLF